MNSNRIWVGGSLALAAIVLLTGWFVGVSPMLSMAAKTESDRSMVMAQNQMLGIALSNLKERYTKLGALKSTLADLRVPLPGDADMPEFFQQLNRVQNATGAAVTSVTVSDGLPFLPVIADIPVEQAPVDPAADGTQTTVADVSAPAEIGPASIPGADLLTPDSFISIPVGLTATGSLEQVSAFLNALQTGNRLFLVTKFTLVKDPAGGAYSVNVSGFAYTVVNTLGSLGDGVGTPVDSTTATVN